MLSMYPDQEAPWGCDFRDMEILDNFQGAFWTHEYKWVKASHCLRGDPGRWTERIQDPGHWHSRAAYYLEKNPGQTQATWVLS